MTVSESSPFRSVPHARLAGVLYLAIIALGLFSELAVRSTLIVRGDAAATAANIAGAERLFRIGFAADLIVFLCDVAVAALLYFMLRPSGKTLSLTAAAFRLTGTAIYGANLLNLLAPLLILGGSGSFAMFAPERLQALALIFLDLHRHGYDLGLVFFGVHCLAIGALLLRSISFPRILGVLMALAGLGYLIGSFTLFLFPESAGAVAPVYAAPLVGELAFCLWLLIRGGKRSAGQPAVDRA